MGFQPWTWGSEFGSANHSATLTLQASVMNKLFIHYLIAKTRLSKYIENFTTKKGKFSNKKKSNIFHISAQNTDYGYS